MERTTIAPADSANPRNDSASIVELADGRLYMVWMEYVRSTLEGNDEAPHRIASMTSPDGGRTWSSRHVLVDFDSDLFVSNPSLLRLNNGDIIFTFSRVWTWNRGETPLFSRYVWRSTDEATTFGDETCVLHRKPHETDPGNKVIQLASGRLVIPMMRITSAVTRGYPVGTLDGGCYTSDDNGRSWVEPQRWFPLPMRGVMEPTVVELGDTTVFMVMRTQLGALFCSRSADGAETWSLPQPTSLRAPESCPALTRIPDSHDLVVVWNNSLYEPHRNHFGFRTPLSVAISHDGGRSWCKTKNLEDEPGWEFTNPAINFTSGGGVVVTYLASRMESVDPPGAFGRSKMDLKAAIADIDWLYA